MEAKEKTVTTMIHHDTFALQAVAHHENLPIKLLYNSRCKWRFYCKANDTIWNTTECIKTTHYRFYRKFYVT